MCIRDSYELSKKTRVFDYKNFFRMTALVLVENPGNPPLALGADHGALFEEIPGTFESYLEDRISQYFSTYGRADAARPTLDQVIEATRNA